MSQNKWTTDATAMREFHIVAYSALVDRLIIKPQPEFGSRPWQLQAYMRIYDAWKETDPFDIPGLTPTNALSTFIAFAISSFMPATRATQTMRLSVRVTRHYGDVSIEYGLDGTYNVPDLSGIAAGYDELRSIVENQHELAAHNRPALSPTQLKDHASQAQAVILATHVHKESIEGKDRIRLLGGEYTRHGVAVYEEYFAKLEIAPALLSYGDTPYNQHVLIQLDGKGNPKRALEIVNTDA